MTTQAKLIAMFATILAVLVIVAQGCDLRQFVSVDAPRPVLESLDLEGVDPNVLLGVLASILRRGAGDFVLAHHIAAALGTPTEWFLDVATIATDFAHELSPATKENP